MRVTGALVGCALLGAGLAAGGAAAGEGTTRTIQANIVVEVEKDLEVKAGEKLVVSRGVRLKFSPGAGIVCRGVLEVRGSAEKPVLFAAKDPEKGWANVALLGAGTAGSVIEHCWFRGGRGRRIKFTSKGLFERFAKPDDKKNALECGGAIFVYLSDKVTIRNCRFGGNKAFWGGAISCWGKAAPLIERCRFTGNSAHWGGAVHCWGRSAATIRLCYFAENVGDKKNGDAGAVQFMNASDGKVESCYFTANSAKWGGAMHVLQQSKPTIAGNYISGNKAWSNSSAISCFGYACPTITGNYISENHVEAEKGVAIATVAHSQPVIKGNYIKGNTNRKEKQANLDACPTFRGKPDKSTCDHREPAEKEKVLEALRKAGVLDLAPKKRAGKGEAEK